MGILPPPRPPCKTFFVNNPQHKMWVRMKKLPNRIVFPSIISHARAVVTGKLINQTVKVSEKMFVACNVKKMKDKVSLKHEN